MNNSTAGDATDETNISIEDFRAYMPDHRYIFVPTRDLWPASSVNSRLPAIDVGTSKPMRPSDWLDQYRAVDQMAWIPGEVEIIKDRLLSNGGWVEKKGSACFNLYRPSTLRLGDARATGPWLDHITRIYPQEAEHIIKWLAHRVQKSGEKINHALVLGGNPGIGKDSILEPIKYAIGPWNFVDVFPKHLFQRFNSFVKSVILRVSEVRDFGDVDRYAFYEHLKTYEAAPPDVISCDEKNIREHPVMNVTGVIITTNHKADGIYLPANDRRHFVAWSNLTTEQFNAEYFAHLYRWYEGGGNAHVAAHLASVDLSNFDAKAPPLKTAAFWDIADANRAPEDAELADALDMLGNPDAVTIGNIVTRATGTLREWLLDRRNRRQIPSRLEAVGYVSVRNDVAKDRLFMIDGRRQAVYAKASLTPRDRIAAVNNIGIP